MDIKPLIPFKLHPKYWIWSIKTYLKWLKNQLLIQIVKDGNK